MVITRGRVTESLNFGLEYEGPALSEHEMDVRDLAPALLSTANFFRSLGHQIDPASPEVQVNIRATSEGSFEIALKLLYDHAVAVLSNRGLVAGEGLTGLLATAVSVILFVRKRGQAGPPVETGQPTPGLVRVTWTDGTVMEFPPDVLRLADETAVRRPLAEMVRPVSRPGIDSLRVLRDGQVAAEVEKEHLGAFDVDALPGHILNTWERNTFLKILTSAWQVGRKWRFTEGRGAFWARIIDEEFNRGLEAGERYGAQDLLHCDVRETQWQDDAGLHTEVTVIRVIERLAPAELPRLFAETAEEEPAIATPNQ